MHMFFKQFSKFANNKKIKDLKSKRLRIRDNLRKLRRGNNYSLISTVDYTEVKLSKPLTTLIRFNTYNLEIKKLTTAKFLTVKSGNLRYATYWNSKILKYIKFLNTSCGFLNLKSIKTSWNYYYLSDKLALLNYRSKFLKNNVDKMLILNNKRTQFYITHLTSGLIGWATDVSAYPGVISSLFGPVSKHTRSKFKKKDKNVIKALNRALTLVLPSFLNKSRNTNKLALVVKSQPRSLEFYDMFIKSLTLSYKIKLPLILLYPAIRYSFIKLRKYARVKRRSRKVITKSSSSLNTSNLSKAYQVQNSSLLYANYKGFKAD